MVVDSHIYNEVYEELYLLEPKLDAVKANIIKIQQDGDTIPDQLAKDLFEMVVAAKIWP